MGLPDIPGNPIFISVRPQLTAYRGKLLSGHPELGSAVHAASFIGERRIILESELLNRSRPFRLILVHELFHFVWPRLSNRIRAEYASLLQRELDCGARGELGESSAVRKASLIAGAKCWKAYVCESFCDTAAFVYSGVREYPDFQLAQRWTSARARWFSGEFAPYWEMRCL